LKGNAARIPSSRKMMFVGKKTARMLGMVDPDLIAGRTRVEREWWNWMLRMMMGGSNLTTLRTDLSSSSDSGRSRGI
jgi:hypothetical protein